MPRARPAGFTFLAVCAVLCAWGMAVALVNTDALPGRFAVAATGALALVTAEALAFVRPWAYSASLAFAGTFVAMLLVVMDDFTEAVILSGLVALPILVALSIVSNGLASRAATGHRIRVP